MTFTATVAWNGIHSVLPTGTIPSWPAHPFWAPQHSARSTAVFTTDSLSAGTHINITAIYGGDANFPNSTSAALSQTISKDGTTTTVFTESDSLSVSGEAVTFQAFVSPNYSGSTQSPPAQSPSRMAAHPSVRYLGRTVPLPSPRLLWPVAATPIPLRRSMAATAISPPALPKASTSLSCKPAAQH